MLEELKKEAVSALAYSYSPYSGFAVGAAVADSKGAIYRGANIENASYGLSICGERSAIFHALSRGGKELCAIAIATATKNPKDVLPCGACRQVMAEFLPPNAPVVLVSSTGETIVYSLEELLPHPFLFKK